MKKIAILLPLIMFAAAYANVPASAQEPSVPMSSLAAADTISVPMNEEFVGEVLLTQAAKQALKKAEKAIKRGSKAASNPKKLFPSKGCRAIRVVTYNVGVFAKSGYDKMFLAADMMNEMKADIVCVNELDSCARRTGRKYQLEDFARLLGKWNFNYTAAMPYQGGSYGIGIASKPKYTPIDQWGITLEKGRGAEQRALSVMEFDKFVIATTHLDHTSDAAQLAQAKTITEVLDQRYHNSRKVVILCGDMNAVPSSRTIKEFQKSWTMVSGKEKSFDSSHPTKCIDYIFVLDNSSSYKVKSTAVAKSFKSGKVSEASDHLPVFVDIIIK